MCAANRSECSECKWYLDISEGAKKEKGTFSQDQSVSIAEQVFGYIAEGIEGTEGKP